MVTLRESPQNDFDQQLNEELFAKHYLDEWIDLAIGMLSTNVGIEPIMAETDELLQSGFKALDLLKEPFVSLLELLSAVLIKELARVNAFI